MASGDRWDDVLDAVLGQLDVTQPDLAFIYASPRFAEFFPDMAQAAWDQSGAMLLAGCSTTGAFAGGLASGNQPSIAMLALSLPGAMLRPVRLTPSMLEEDVSPDS